MENWRITEIIFIFVCMSKIAVFKSNYKNFVGNFKLGERGGAVVELEF